MVAPLRRVLLCTPKSACWKASGRVWFDLGFLREPDFAAAVDQHLELREKLERDGCEVVDLPEREGLSPDAVYAHDPSFMTDAGALCLRMGKSVRSAEPEAHFSFYASAGIPVIGEIEAPGTVEGGDLVWLSPTTLLAGRGYRTNPDGIAQLRRLLSPSGVTVVTAPLPHASGPGACLHLMSLLSLLDETTALVDLPCLAVETVELLLASGFRLLEIDATERETLACNVLSLGNGKLLALAENPKTNGRLKKAGFQVLTFQGSEIAINGGGGPTCLTRPLLRLSAAFTESRS